ncbi:hypothetical protein BHE74_00012330, partial [Ensete ventricosum]
CLNLFEHDTVGIILIVPFPVMALFQSQLNDAIAKEAYEDAVKLKLAIAGATENDIVGTAISTMNVGWWSGFSEDGADPYGRIIHISAEYGRYVARSYSPRCITCFQTCLVP